MKYFSFFSYLNHFQMLLINLSFYLCINIVVNLNYHVSDGVLIGTYFIYKWSISLLFS